MSEVTNELKTLTMVLKQCTTEEDNNAVYIQKLYWPTEEEAAETELQPGVFMAYKIDPEEYANNYLDQYSDGNNIATPAPVAFVSNGTFGANDFISAVQFGMDLALGYNYNNIEISQPASSDESVTVPQTTKIIPDVDAEAIVTNIASYLQDTSYEISSSNNNNAGLCIHIKPKSEVTQGE